MPDYAPARHRQILKLLKRHGQIRNTELEKTFGVTAMTVWRDLTLLESQGLLKRVRGGALDLNIELELAYSDKQNQASGEKRRIAKYVAAHCLEAGDILILDGGTTIASLALEILPEQLTILTNSLQIASAMIRHPSAPTVYLSGGLVRPESGTMVGREALTFFSRRRAGKFLMSATGVDLQAGVTDPNPQEIEVKQAMAASAKSIILLSDASKFEVVSLMQTLPWKSIGKMVTTESHPITLALRKKGIEVCLA